MVNETKRKAWLYPLIAPFAGSVLVLGILVGKYISREKCFEFNENLRPERSVHSVENNKVGINLEVEVQPKYNYSTSTGECWYSCTGRLVTVDSVSKELYSGLSEQEQSELVNKVISLACKVAEKQVHTRKP